MLNEIANYIYDTLNKGQQPYTFWGGGWTLAGFVKNLKDENGNLYPAVGDAECCNSGVLIPSPDKKGIIFFELLNLKQIQEGNCGWYYSAKIKMYVWYNTCLLGVQNGLYLSLINDLLRVNNLNINLDSIKGLCLTQTDLTVCDDRIFGQYKYIDTAILNTPPYESFSVIFNAEFSFCTELPEFGEPTKCECLC